MKTLEEEHDSPRKRALLIGINYFGSKTELKGCINDAKDVQKLLWKHYGYHDFEMLTDDNPKKMPTRENIVKAIDELVLDAKPGDLLVFHYSGHGRRTFDFGFDESDFYDEAIVPCDHSTAGILLDDTLKEILVQRVPEGCRLTAIADCSYSGSILDLPYSYLPTKVKLTDNMSLFSLAWGFFLRIFWTLISLFSKKTKLPSNAVLLSGSSDCQFSYDSNLDGTRYNGIMTNTLIKVLDKKPHSLSYQELLDKIHSITNSKNGDHANFNITDLNN